jgi:TfoX/Sxy family transcriptional regulator of competence genes
MTQQHVDLIERVRALLTDRPSTREVSMFGGRSFMVNDKMIANVRNGGDLLLRVDPNRQSELGELAGASPAVMGPGRTMGPGWISVSAESITGDEQLSFWIDVALEHNEATARSRR